MNSDDIIDALEHIDEDDIKNARKPLKKKSRKALWISVSTVAACLTLVLLLPEVSHQLKHRFYDGFECDCDKFAITPTPAPDTTSNLLGISFEGDFRERNNFSVTSKVSAITWPLEYQFICSQYPYVEYNGIKYGARTSYTGDDVSEAFIGNKLGEVEALGGGISCELYELSGVAADRFLAVKYEGSDEYYVFMQDTFAPPATLGDLITSLNLTETFPLTLFTTDKRGEDTYSLSSADSDALWELFLSHADSKTITTDHPREELPLGDKIISFTVDAEALGVSNLSWRLTSGGYLLTNIENYGYYYNLGTDAVEKISDYALTHKTTAPKRTFKLIGEITEITDRFIKVNDSICMKNPADGMEFTVELNDLRLQRYVYCDYLEVGDHIVIYHTGAEKDSPTHITTAYELNTGSISVDGAISVPESAGTKDLPCSPTPTPAPNRL